jgi:hypothetical protein
MHRQQQKQALYDPWIIRKPGSKRRKKYSSMEAHRHGEEKGGSAELTNVWKQGPWHGEAVPARPRPLQIQGGHRRYADELHGQHNNTGTTAQVLPRQHPHQVGPRAGGASTARFTARQRLPVDEGDSPRDPAGRRSGIGGRERRNRVDGSIDHRTAVQLVSAARSGAAGVGLSVAAAMAATLSPRGRQSS